MRASFELSGSREQYRPGTAENLYLRFLIVASNSA
jgi:hypothetical protein